MSRIVWRDQMAIGIREIDDDHRALIDIINRLDDLARESTPDFTQLADCLLRLIRYTREHFDREEKLMASVRFPGVAKHRESHAAFADGILAESQKFLANPEAVTARSVHATLADWILHHVVNADRDIIPHVRARVPVNDTRWTPDSD